jgi:hypothetical protein
LVQVLPPQIHPDFQLELADTLMKHIDSSFPLQMYEMESSFSWQSDRW